MSAEEGFVHHVEHGLVVGLPIDARVTRAEWLARLHPEERALTASFGDLRVRTFAAGRVVLRDALAHLGHRSSAPILRTPRGAPALPADLAARMRVSISHKDTLAVALVSPVSDAHVGVDVELEAHAPGDIARHVLTAPEHAHLEALDPSARARELMLRFSMKEALYKALDPWLQRFIGFREVETWPGTDAPARLLLPADAQGLAVDARHLVRDGLIITTARALR